MRGLLLGKEHFLDAVDVVLDDELLDDGLLGPAEGRGKTAVRSAMASEAGNLRDFPGKKKEAEHLQAGLGTAEFMFVALFMAAVAEVFKALAVHRRNAHALVVERGEVHG